MLVTSLVRRSRSLDPAVQAAWAIGGSRALSWEAAITSTATTAPAAVPFIAAAPVEIEAAGPILSAGMATIDSFHNITGLPWWASIAVVGLGVRTAMLPISLKGMKASGALFSLIKKAREDVAAETTPSPSSTEDYTLTNLEDGNHQKSKGSTPQPQNWAAISRRFHQLRSEAGAPHPLWVIGSPLMQLPLFLTVMGSIRTMSLNSWPGFSNGGTAWFPDLTQPAADFANMAAPMGPAGIILPLSIALSMYANIDAAFSVPTKTTPSPSQSNSTLLYVMGKVRLALEWAVVPLFVVSLQLPQGALCYWATSSAFALAQNHALKLPAVRALAGLPTGAGAAGGNRTSSSTKKNTNITNNSATNYTSNRSSAQPAVVTQQDAALAALFAKAAEHQAMGKGTDAAAVLQTILDNHPHHPRALFALAQVQSGLKEWASAAESYLAATRHEEDEGQRCRVWFGAGVALHMKGDEEGSIEAFSRAAGPAANEQLRVRAWVAAAQLEEKLGRRDKAVALLRQAAQVEPKVEEVYLKPLLGGNKDGNRGG